MLRTHVAILFSVIFLLLSCKEEGGYVCPPCDSSCDSLNFPGPGICPHCNMTLITKEELLAEESLLVNEFNFGPGRGVILVEGGNTKRESHVRVYYYMPADFNDDSNILLVIPGAGRDGDEYRNAWIDLAEEHNILILSLQYNETDYDFGEYHMANLLTDLNIESCIKYVENSNHALLDENCFQFNYNANESSWLFEDFDRIFLMVVDALDTQHQQYDIFGHSAGAQILSRMAVFQKTSKVNRIVAANAGFYTLPDVELALPFGIKGSSMQSSNLESTFAKKLIIMVGERDTETERRGTLLRSPTVDQQGVHRLSRAKHMYERSNEIANSNSYQYNWEISFIRGTGHDFRDMSLAAAARLYNPLVAISKD